MLRTKIKIDNKTDKSVSDRDNCDKVQDTIIPKICIVIVDGSGYF